MCLPGGSKDWGPCRSAYSVQRKWTHSCCTRWRCLLCCYPSNQSWNNCPYPIKPWYVYQCTEQWPARYNVRMGCRLTPSSHCTNSCKIVQIRILARLFFFAFRSRPRIGHLGSFLLSANIFSIVLYVPFLSIFSSFFQFFLIGIFFDSNFFYLQLDQRNFVLFCPIFLWDRSCHSYAVDFSKSTKTFLGVLFPFAVTTEISGP